MDEMIRIKGFPCTVWHTAGVRALSRTPWLDHTGLITLAVPVLYRFAMAQYARPRRDRAMDQRPFTPAYSLNSESLTDTDRGPLWIIYHRIMYHWDICPDMDGNYSAAYAVWSLTGLQIH